MRDQPVRLTRRPATMHPKMADVWDSLLAFFMEYPLLARLAISGDRLCFGAGHVSGQVDNRRENTLCYEELLIPASIMKNSTESSCLRPPSHCLNVLLKLLSLILIYLDRTAA